MTLKTYHPPLCPVRGDSQGIGEILIGPCLVSCKPSLIAFRPYFNVSQPCSRFWHNAIGQEKTLGFVALRISVICEQTTPSIFPSRVILTNQGLRRAPLTRTCNGRLKCDLECTPRLPKQYNPKRPAPPVGSNLAQRRGRLWGWAEVAPRAGHHGS